MAINLRFSPTDKSISMTLLSPWRKLSDLWAFKLGCSDTAEKAQTNCRPREEEPLFERASAQPGNPSLDYGAMKKGAKDMVYKTEETCTWYVCKAECAGAQRSSPPLFQPIRCKALTGFSATSVWFSYYHVQQIISTTVWFRKATVFRF